MSARALNRNLEIYDAKDPETVLGGLILTNGITNANFYSMVGIAFVINQTYTLRDESGMTIQKGNHSLQPGKYFIVTAGSIKVSDEPWLVRTDSISTGTRTMEFRDAIRERDCRCVITKEEVPGPDRIWQGFEATHVFPLAHEGHWISNNYDRWITIPAESGGPINSVQNGMLLRADIHSLFDNYCISINPDDNFKIVFFIPDNKGISGTHLDQAFIDDPKRPVDELLRWHFGQAVLANMRGGGEPVFETDFPSGSDMIGEITTGPNACERMEFELFSRLAGYSKLT